MCAWRIPSLKSYEINAVLPCTSYDFVRFCLVTFGEGGERQLSTNVQNAAGLVKVFLLPEGLLEKDTQLAE